MSPRRRRLAALGRVAALLLGSWLLHSVVATRGAEAERPLTLAEVRALVADASGLEWNAGARALGPEGEVLCELLTSLPGSAEIRGYVGPSDVLLAVSPGGEVAGARLRWSADTPGHVEDVVQADAFWAGFRGRSVDELRALGGSAQSWRDAGFDAVSGATRTSDCVFRSVAHALGGEPEPAPLNWHDGVLALLSCVLLAVAAGWIAGGSRWAWSLRILACAGLGLVLEDLLSLALFGGWVSAGLPWRSSPGMVALAASALLAPLLGGRNAYCTHVCPLGTLQTVLQRGLGARQRKLPAWLAGVLLRVPLALIVVAAAVTAAGLDLDPAKLEAFDGFGLQDAAVVSLALLVIGLVAAIFLPLAYCRYACGTGALLNFVQRGRAGGGVSGVALSLLLATLLLLPSLVAAQRAERLEGLLEQLAAGLTEFHSESGSYPPMSPSTAAELVPLLLAQGCLDQAPINPVTGEAYGSDPFEVDRVWYVLESGGGACVLEILGPDGSTVLAARRLP